MGRSMCPKKRKKTKTKTMKTSTTMMTKRKVALMSSKVMNLLDIEENAFYHQQLLICLRLENRVFFNRRPFCQHFRPTMQIRADVDVWLLLFWLYMLDCLKAVFAAGIIWCSLPVSPLNLLLAIATVLLAF